MDLWPNAMFGSRRPYRRKINWSLLAAMFAWDVGKQQTQGILKLSWTILIRNRDHSVHRLSAVRALNLHRRRSTCVLLTNVGCKRSWNPISTSIAKMQGDSGETPFHLWRQRRSPCRRYITIFSGNSWQRGKVDKDDKIWMAKRWLLDIEEH